MASPFNPDGEETGAVFLDPSRIVESRPQPVPLFRQRLIVLVFFVGQILGLVVGGLMRPAGASGFDWVVYTYVGWVFPALIGAVIWLIGWLLNPNPRRSYY